MADRAHGGGDFLGGNKDSEGSLSSFLSSDPDLGARYAAGSSAEASAGAKGHGRAHSSGLPLNPWRSPAIRQAGDDKMVDWSEFAQDQVGAEPKKPKNVGGTKVIVDSRVLEEDGARMGAQFIDWAAVGEVEVVGPQDHQNAQNHSGGSLTFSNDSSMDVLILPDGPSLGGKGGHDHSTASTTVDWNAVGPTGSGPPMQARGKSARRGAGPTCCSFLAACQASSADQEGDAEQPPGSTRMARPDHDEVIQLSATGRHIAGGI